MTEQSTALACHELSAGYDGVPVLRDFSMSVGRAEVAAIMGRNGAGKTTLLRTLSGLMPRLSGQISYGGDPISSASAFAIARQGVRVVMSEGLIFAGLTVQENLLVGQNRQRQQISVDEVIQLFPFLKNRRNQHAGNLSGGEQRILATAMAFLGGPSVLLFDDFSEGLQPSIVQKLLEALRAMMKQRPISLIVVEQSLDVVLEISQVIYVIRNGRKVLEANADSVADNPQLVLNEIIGG